MELDEFSQSWRALDEFSQSWRARVIPENAVRPNHAACNIEIKYIQ